MELLIKTGYIAASIAAPFGSPVSEFVSNKQATACIERAFDAMTVYHGGALADEIERAKRKLVLELLKNAMGDNKQLSQAAVNCMIQKSAMRILFGANCDLNELPTWALGNMSPIEMVTRLLYVKSIRQMNGWTCGFRAALAALKLNYLVSNRKAISNEAISDFGLEYFPPKFVIL